MTAEERALRAEVARLRAEVVALQGRLAQEAGLATSATGSSSPVARAARRLLLSGGSIAVAAVARRAARRPSRGERHRSGMEDDFGFDPAFTEGLLPLAGWIYDHWWRVEATGVEHVPASGPGLIVGNHGGVLPLDGAVLKTALQREHPTRRHLRVLVMDWIMSIPFISPFMRRTGQTVACADDAIELLRRGELVCTFPEGANGTGKLFGERYRLRRFGRGGFVRTALRTGAPIVPVAIVGAEEIYPMFHDFRPVARVLGSPYFPITPTWPWLGPLGLIPLPTKWLVEFCPPIHLDGYGPEDADDAALVLRLSEEVRALIQAKVDELRARRPAVFAR